MSQKLLANPGAWNCLEEDEKREILGLLPEGTHPTPEPEATPDDPDPKIAPLPQSFIRYSNNWRDGIRQFQLDLQNGRYSDGWLRQAEKARQQRTEGDFDAFKEREFEQFWGQKQKVDYRVLTGESSRVRLKTLVKEGVFLPGDIWKYSYVFGRDSERVHVEKEAKVWAETICSISTTLITKCPKVLEITGSELAFVIPNGQHVFLSSVQHEQYSPETETTKVFKSPMAKEIKTALKGQDQSGSASVVVLSPNPHNQPSNDEGQHKRTAPPPDPQPPAKRKRGRPRKHPIKPGKKPGDDPSIWDIPSSPPALASDKEPGEQSVLDIPSFNEEIAMTEGPTKQQSNPGPDAPKQEDEGEEEDTTPTTKLPQPHETTAHQRGEILVRNISNPSTLATKILKVDGRRSGFRHSNSWQEFRCYRNNQDMGSLWDVRQAWFLSQEKKEKDEEEGENDEVEEWEE